MLSLWGFFWKKQTDDDWNSVLDTLTLSIEKRRTAIKELQRRQARFTKLLTHYALLFWIAYAILWQLGVLPRDYGYGSQTKNMSKALQAFPLIFEPLLFIILLSVVKAWYTRKGISEERRLQQLLKQKQAAIKEIKDKTKFHATYELLQRHEGPASANNSALRRRTLSFATTPTAPRPIQPSTPKGNAKPIVKPEGQVQQVIVVAPVRPSPSTQRRWYDRLADFILGEDASACYGSATNKYALVCGACHAHNGLVKEAIFDNLPFACLVCRYKNPSYKSKLEQIQKPKAESVPETSVTSSVEAPPRSPQHQREVSQD